MATGDFGKILNSTPANQIVRLLFACCCLFCLVTLLFFFSFDESTFISRIEFFIGAHNKDEEVLIVKDSRYEESNRYNAKEKIQKRFLLLLFKLSLCLFFVYYSLVLINDPTNLFGQ